MQESFLTSVRIVVPMALLMALGALIRRSGIIDRPTMRQLDRLLFRVFMPTLLFKNIYEMDISRGLSFGLMLFVGTSLLGLGLVALTVPRRITRDSAKAASIGQALVRSNYILFGLAIAESLYGEGNVGIVALLGAFTIPIMNALAVIVMETALAGRARLGPIAVS
ncbi:MAG: AEC family transporter, partial [Synergistaceae bacterium]|nr:AEC family transporter [Synergistaceae bacterium]